MDISQSIDKLTAKAVVPLTACRQATAFDSNKKRETSTTEGYSRSTRKTSIEQTVEETATTAMKIKAYYQTWRRNRSYKVSFLQCFKRHRLSLNTSISIG
jgi:hypothetical protein